MEGGDTLVDDSTPRVLCIVLDLAFPTDGVLYRKCQEVLENVLAWAFFAPNKVSLVGVTTAQPSLQRRLQFAPLSGNFSAISSLLSVAFRNAGNSHEHMTDGDLTDALFMTTKQVALHLSETQQAERGGPVALTVITCRDGGLVCDAVHAALDRLHEELVACLDALTVVQLSSEPSAQSRCSVRGSPREEGPPVWLVVVAVEAVEAVAESRAQRAAQARLEAALRTAWFTPRWSELLPLRLELGPRASVLQCVAAQCVLEPAVLPVGDHFDLLAACGGGGTRGCSDGRVLRAVSRVAADGVCEGSMFGLPLRVTWAPASGFRRRDAFHRNAHLFLALCESLTGRDEQMVVKLQTGATSASGHFVLMPGDACMLLRAVASAELCLPPPPPPAMQYDGVLAAWAEQEVAGVLDALPVEEQYLAKDHPSGLCAALRLAAGFPPHLSLQQAKRAVAEVAGTSTSPSDAAAPAAADAVATLVLSSDDEDLPEVNANALPASAPGAHKLGTGGHPALQDDFGTPRARKFQPLHGVFKKRRQQ